MVSRFTTLISSIRASDVWRLLKKNRKFWVSLTIALFIVVLGVVGPFLTEYGPKTPTESIRAPPSIRHPFGTDFFGYDVFAETVYGIRVSLSLGLLVALVATMIGIFLGMIAGLKGGFLDALIDTIINILLIIPPILIIILIYVHIGKRSFIETGLLIASFSWHWTARAVRSQVASLKVSEYISSSFLSGNSFTKVLVRDILPNIASYSILAFVIQLSNAIMTIVTLEFLGFGVAEWSLGAIVQLAVLWGGIPLGIWWWYVFPGIIIVALIASLYILVVSLEEVFNPRLRRV